MRDFDQGIVIQAPGGASLVPTLEIQEQTSVDGVCRALSLSQRRGSPARTPLAQQELLGIWDEHVRGN